jgi:chaperonin cofactor prefoldin
VESLQQQLKGMMNNQVNIERLQTDMDKALEDIEKLKDKIRDQKNGGIE